MPAPTFRPHRNLLAELVVHLEREAHAAKRRADEAGDTAQRLEARGKDATGAHLSLARDRGVQDALFNVVGRLNNVLTAPLESIVDTAELQDEIRVALSTSSWVGTSSPKALGPSEAARVAIGVLERHRVNGATPAPVTEVDA